MDDPDPMLIVTRCAYGVPEGSEQLDRYLDEALGGYATALLAHLSAVRDTALRARRAAADPTAYRPDGLASLTERLERAMQPFIELDREFARYALAPSQKRS